MKEIRTFSCRRLVDQVSGSYVARPQNSVKVLEGWEELRGQV